MATSYGWLIKSEYSKKKTQQFKQDFLKSNKTIKMVMTLNYRVMQNIMQILRNHQLIILMLSLN